MTFISYFSKKYRKNYNTGYPVISVILIAYF